MGAEHRGIARCHSVFGSWQTDVCSHSRATSAAKFLPDSVGSCSALTEPARGCQGQAPPLARYSTVVPDEAFCASCDTCDSSSAGAEALDQGDCRGSGCAESSELQRGRAVPSAAPNGAPALCSPSSLPLMGGIYMSLRDPPASELSSRSRFRAPRCQLSSPRLQARANQLQQAHSFKAGKPVAASPKR